MSRKKSAIDSDVERLLKELLALRDELTSAAESPHRTLQKIHGNFCDSARNLLHYLAMRRRDMRPLQEQLAAAGLSSLGRAEAHVLAAVDAILGILHRLSGTSWSPPDHAIGYERGPALLAQHANSLLGRIHSDRGARIMVTMPSEAAHNYTLVHDLLKQGMDCMRINCAHDDPAVWRQIIEHLRRAERALNRRCRVAIDLGGPKLRTGPIEPGPAVLKVRPSRNALGEVVAPARIWLTSRAAPLSPPSPADAVLPLGDEELKPMKNGDRLRFTDARGSKRELDVVDILDTGSWAELEQTAYFAPGTLLRCKRRRVEAEVGDLPRRQGVLRLNIGDLLRLTRNLSPGRPPTYDSGGELLTPATIGCTLAEVFEDVKAGEGILFDDGKIAGVIEQLEQDQVLVRITRAPIGGAKLKADKGINLPETRLRLPALTDKDVEDLTFAYEHADLIQLSFANTAQDVELLLQHLTRLGERQPGIVLKVETHQGFQNLPEMLLAAMQWPCCGVMIARGDLAVESGFERLAEVQEEMLWICEAAHVPVIWATQVLDSLAKKGMPSRAEITDAAMAHRAECVMLNKGEHILMAVQVLNDILQRMQSHQSKKKPMMRELSLAHITDL